MLKFQDLYESYAEEIYHFAVWLTGNSQEAEDITSETFTRAWTHHRKIQTETLKAYLFTIARNIYLQHKRKNKHQVVLEDIYPDPSPGPDRLVESRIELEKVHQILQTLTEIDRSAFIMRVQHDLPYSEIARVLALTLSSTKVKVHRVRKKLIEAFIDKEVY